MRGSNCEREAPSQMEWLWKKAILPRASWCLFNPPTIDSLHDKALLTRRQKKAISLFFLFCSFFLLWKSPAAPVYIHKRYFRLGCSSKKKKKKILSTEGYGEDVIVFIDPQTFLARQRGTEPRTLTANYSFPYISFSASHCSRPFSMSLYCAGKGKRRRKKYIYKILSIFSERSSFSEQLCLSLGKHAHTGKKTRFRFRSEDSQKRLHPPPQYNLIWPNVQRNQ